MARSPEQIEQNRHIWEDLHLLAGKTNEAASLAMQHLSRVDTKRFHDFEVAEWHGELAAQVVTLSRSASRKTENAEEKQHLLEQATRTVLDHYPVATTHDETKSRSEYWKPVFGSVDAHMRCLRDCINLLREIQTTQLSAAESMSVLALLSQLTAIAQAQTSESGKLILTIENGTRVESARAYLRFLLQEGRHSYSQNRPEFDAAFKKFAKRLIQGKPKTENNVQNPELQIDSQLLNEFLSIGFIGMSLSVYSLLTSASDPRSSQSHA